MEKEWMPISEQEYIQLKSHLISIDDFALNQAEHSKYPPWFHYESCD